MGWHLVSSHSLPGKEAKPQVRGQVTLASSILQSQPLLLPWKHLESPWPPCYGLTPSSQPHGYFLREDRLVSLPRVLRKGPDTPLGMGSSVFTYKHSSSEKVWHRHGGKAL